MIDKNDVIEFREFMLQKLQNTLDLLASLQDSSINEIQKLEDPEIKKNCESIRETISQGISKFETKAYYLDKGFNWEDLCIGFFGETNAGKSTLIESLIGGDGRSIGDGRKDFTRKLEFRAYQHIKLLDMPGIEGNEKKVQQNIMNAVKNAHIVFYVVPHNKEPERETLKKVKRYLSNKTKIYSIINIRKPISVFKYQRDLVDNNVEIVAKRTTNIMKEVFGDSYAGNMLVHAMLSFLSRGVPRQANIIEDQKKIMEIFGSKEKALTSSGFLELQKIIDESSKYINIEIIRSNGLEVISEMSSLVGNILKEKKGVDSFSKRSEKLFSTKRNDIERIFEKHKNYINNKKSTIINNYQNRLFSVIDRGIDNGWGESMIKSEISKEVDGLQKTLNNSLKESVSLLNNEINMIMQELSMNLELQRKFTIDNIEINIKEILGKLEISFGYIVKQFLELVFAIPMLFGGIFGMIGGIFLIFRKIVDWLFDDPEKRKGGAKKKAYEELKDKMNQIEVKFSMTLNHEIDKISRDIHKKFLEQESSFALIHKSISYITEYVTKLKKIKADISTKICHILVDNRISKAYIERLYPDYYISIIGMEKSAEIEEKVYKNLSISKDKIFCFSTNEDLKKRCSELRTQVKTELEKKGGAEEFFNRIHDVLV